MRGQLGALLLGGVVAAFAVPGMASDDGGVLDGTPPSAAPVDATPKPAPAPSSEDAGPLLPVPAGIDHERPPEPGAKSVSDAPPPTPGAHAQPPREAALVRERPSPLVFRVAEGGRDARARADAAGSALHAALDAPAVEGAPVVQVRIQGDQAIVEVKGRAVATITRGDAAAEAASLETYAALLETRLHSFVEEELRRSSVQALALRIFLTVVFVLLGLFTWRALRGAFDRWEKSLEASQPKPLTLLGTPFLSSDARRGLVAIGLVGGRLLSSLALLAVLGSVILGQFDATRPLLARAAATAAAPLLRGVDALVGAIPGVLLAAGLVVAARALLRFAELLLDGVAQGRVSSSWIGPSRVLPARAMVVIGGIIIASPLVAAAAFGRFGSPLEHLSLAAGACVFLAAVPSLASATAGVIFLWQGELKAGDWIEVGAVRGAVSATHLFHFVVATEDGATVSVPMLALVVLPLRRLPTMRTVLVIHVKRDRPLAELEQTIQRVASEADADAQAEFIDLGATALSVAVRSARSAGRGRASMVRAMALAAERGEISFVDPPAGQESMA